MNNLAPESQNQSTKKSPNNILASIVCERMKSEGLIHSRHQNELLSKLKRGGVNQDDWKLWIELAIAEDEKQVKEVQ